MVKITVPLVRSSSLGEVGVQRMDPPVAVLKKKRPAGECAGRGEGRSVRPVVQEVGVIKKDFNWKLMDDEEDDHVCVFTLGLDIYDKDNGGGGGDQSVDCRFGGFFENCSYCKRCMGNNIDVYMYGYLKAFCSPDCREQQIEIDQRLRPPSPEPSNLSTILKIIEKSDAQLTRLRQKPGLD
ncbi:hypothetical protein DCAR_0935638 [Daucus carota subsp. sativus]|uniref:FLZ-type domain-containing protein n=1 Tax=Daucus carota subsp. sativus TaxID=79200 RepID=A0AAF0Y0K5_DAUCS|nr:PREDICTED: uncharacterized protein LOC108201859 [Daucus carota subsp. sativus]WOH16089.1 hypothetical protein DCAR_0935638 [Daucus carota subsp. sativus]